MCERGIKWEVILSMAPILRGYQTPSHVVPVSAPACVSQRLNACFVAGHWNMGVVSQFVCTQALRPGQPQQP